MFAVTVLTRIIMQEAPLADAKLDAFPKQVGSLLDCRCHDAILTTT